MEATLSCYASLYQCVAVTLVRPHGLPERVTIYSDGFVL